jgi:tRNA pseudouridine55 synthase
MAWCGILNVNKPAGCTSRDVVDRVEQFTRPQRAGHAGTLDPLATGVLVICVGRATRLIEYVQRMRKRYDASFLLGRRSETDDVEGDVVAMPGAPEPSRIELDRAIPQFLGDIEQRPPIHSAVKVSGRRAYALARRGQSVELAPRRVEVYQLAVRRYAYPELELEIECSSGTYVRALGRDLAAALGTGAVMSSLARTAIGRYRIEQAVPVATLNSDTLPRFLQPAESAVAELPHVTLDETQRGEIRNGRPIGRWVDAPAGGAKPQTGGEWAAVDEAGNLLAILREKHAGQLWPVKNFS